MKRRSHLLVAHWLNGLLTAIIAAVAVLLLRHLVTTRCTFITNGIAAHRFIAPSIAILIPIVVAIAWPARVFVSLSAVALFRRHMGVFLKTVLGIISLVVVDLLLGMEWRYYANMDSLTHVALPLVAGTALAYGYARWQTNPNPQARTNPPEGPETQDQWAIGDEPIETLAENRFPEHESTASRILTKLLSEGRDSCLFPNVALIGPYGSGKTSLCNLVKDLYRKRAEEETLPKVLFCRFEAWQYLSPEAAIRGLVQAVTEEILTVVDELQLWTLPNHYAEAIKNCGWSWAGSIIPFLSCGDNPRHVLDMISDTLVRLDLRVVVFVDDFDRIEHDCSATQQAVAKALNQFQTIPNLQYVITVGPMTAQGSNPGGRDVSWDLLKLTRYQELVPAMATRHMVELVKKHRDLAQRDPSCLFPWAYETENDRDPLTFHPEFVHLYSSIGLIGDLVGLVDTPRACNSALRETVAAWNHGLEGEIDWYDLLLMNALKTAEPGVFSWIARDLNLFVEKPGEFTGNDPKQERRNYARQLREQLGRVSSSSDPRHLEILESVLARLFPNFGRRLSLGQSKQIPDSWSQKVSLRASTRSDYCRRFFEGCVPENDVPDLPTLQYIRRITEEGFRDSDFTRLYLDTYEKLTGPLNKIVQFTGLIPRRLAFQIGDAILDWIADPAHAISWPEPEYFIQQILADIFSIVNQAQSGFKERAPRSAEANGRIGNAVYNWAEAAVKRHMATAPSITLRFAQQSREGGFTRVIEELPKAAFKEFRHQFIEEGIPLLPCLAGTGSSLRSLIELLLDMDEEQYRAMKSGLTEILISQLQNLDDEPSRKVLMHQIVLVLVSIVTPQKDDPIQIYEHQLIVEPDLNEQVFDMEKILPVVKGWSPEHIDDDLGKRALGLLKREYDLA